MFWSWACSSIGVPPGFEHYVAADVQFQAAAPFTWFGWVGVETFFVISGFVIANSAIKSSVIEFLFGRALRLYPAVWVCSTLTFVVLVCWLICAKIEPVMRCLLKDIFSNLGRLRKQSHTSILPSLSPGLRLLPIRAKVNFTGP
jgi:hypothetical protein